MQIKDITRDNLWRGTMKICILMGSPRLHGNTAEILKPFIEELKNMGAQIEYITTDDKKVQSCKGCYHCQNELNTFGCVQHDDMEHISTKIIESDILVLATPIYAWYCTSSMKVVIDRLAYGMNKFYGTKGAGSLWHGKKCAIIATHGYDAQYATEPFETGIKRLCDHSKLNYSGMYSVRDEENLASFKTKEAINGSKDFAKKLLASIDC